ncbi:MAG: argininosuccinate lyase [candidate division CPR3 bacterium GW2011_GWE2_35_7]|nr:MAG: argininosuccinate lyase [candidate division CPR3 bacterium GW2011_GWE2_35_7]
MHNKFEKQQVNKLWGEAFNKKPKEKAILFAAGRDVRGLPPADEQLIPYEIEASIAWVKGLSDQKIIDKKTLEKIIEGLKEINTLYVKGEFYLDPQKEDVHSNIESYLVKKYGIDIGGRIHSGRSRSEQGIVDIILYLKDKNLFFKQELKDLIDTLNALSEKYQYVILPAYTHHQHATVMTFGNMLDCYTQTFKKDVVPLLMERPSR